MSINPGPRIGGPQPAAAPDAAGASSSNRTRTATSFVVIGLVLATVGFGLTFYLGTQLAGSTPTVQVLVARRAIAAGTSLSQADVAPKNYLAASAPASSLHRADEVVGRIARVDIAAGDPILASMVGSVSQGFAPVSVLPVPPGYAAVQFAVPPPAGPLIAGEYVDVIATVNLSVFTSGATGSVSRVVFPAVEVVHVPGQSQQSQPLVMVGLLMNECDLAYATWLASSTTLTVALLPQQQGGAPPADTTCSGLVTNRAVGAAEANARFHFTR